LKRHFALFLIILPLFGYGQQESVFPRLVGTSSRQNITTAEAQVHHFISTLNQHPGSSDIALLKKVFHQTQKVFLRQYELYPDFSEIFNSGRYDCLTATALFSVVLGELNFKFSIIETNYHIFLLVKTSKGDVLLETTDRFNGFVKNEKEIRQRIGTYRRGVTAGSDQNIYQYHCDLYREVEATRLPGLLYYNQAVKAYNEGRLERCGELLAKAKAIYDTPRITAFGSIFLKSVLASSLDDTTKLRIIRQLRDVARPKSPVLASR
jgi:hypothetical protein